MLWDLSSQHQTIIHHITMKTLVVLSALACVAIAAPAPQENGFPTLDTPDGILPINFNTELAGPEVSARSHFGLKSPIVVKKKTGYHLYRDSTEERANADPRENCSKHLRVKLCDDNIAAKSADLRRSTKIEDIDGHKIDVEDSIKIAKEAVESLQQDLQNIEHGSSSKNAQWKHGESDKIMHEDIEVASHALAHAQKDFGKLESMSLRTTTLRDSETLHDLSKGKTDEERVAQWKEAMKNIQRNVEIARNIEDSFRSSSSFTPAEAIDTTTLMKSDSHINTADSHKLAAKDATSLMISSRKTENTNLNTMEKKPENHMTSGQWTHENIGHMTDMKSAASEVKHLKQQQPNQATLNTQATQGKLAEVSLNIQNQPLGLKHSGVIESSKGKSTEMDLTMRTTNTGVNMPPHVTSMSLKKEHVENGHHHHHEVSALRASESTHHISAIHKDESTHMKTDATNNMDTTKFDTMQKGKSVAKEWETNTADKHLKKEKSAWAETENKEMLMKAAEHKNIALNSDLKQGKPQNTVGIVDTKLTMKSAEHLPEHKKHLEDDAESFIKKSGVAVHSDMKLADNAELSSDIALNAPLNVNLDQDTKMNIEQSNLEKSADVTDDLHMDQLRHAHELSHAHAHAHAHAYAHGQTHGHGLGHMHKTGPLMHPFNKHELVGHGHMLKHHGGYHGKSAEVDSVMHPSMQMNMRESALENNMLQWKHHDMARSYGAGLGYGSSGLGLSAGGSGLSYSAGGSGGSAVGVFPNAKIGGCGIPLLLSCSPSVVSGSLAKSHGYAAPSYRHEEDFKFKNKRDIIKANDLTGSKIKHSTKTTQPKNLEKKL